MIKIPNNKKNNALQIQNFKTHRVIVSINEFKYKWVLSFVFD